MNLRGGKGPSEIFTPINVWDIASETGQPFSLRFATGTDTALLILRGSLKMGQKPYEEQSILIFEREGDVVEFESSDNFKALILNGKPIDETSLLIWILGLSPSNCPKPLSGFPSIRIEYLSPAASINANQWLNLLPEVVPSIYHHFEKLLVVTQKLSLSIDFHF